MKRILVTTSQQWDLWRARSAELAESRSGVTVSDNLDRVARARQA